MKFSMNLCILPAISIFLCSCGGGSSANVAPVANAGFPQSINAGATVSLDGSASSDVNNDALTYNWVLTSKPTGSTAILSSSTVVRPTFIADIAGTYTGSLTVNDGKVDSSASSFTIGAVVSVTDFVQFWQPKACGIYVSRVFVIDQHLVYSENVSLSCADVGSSILSESTPGHLLCAISYGIGVFTHCDDQSYRAIFDTILANLGNADLGLGPTHQVQLLYTRSF